MSGSHWKNEKLDQVISGLEHHAGIADVGCWQVEGNEINPACPYYDDEDNKKPACGTELLMDAINLLKEYDSALRGMVYQYCTEEHGEKEEFFHYFMSAGEEAFKVLGIENGEEVTEEFIWS